MTKFVLASGSPRRIVNLRNAGYDFEIKPAEVDEAELMKPPPEDACQEIALKKAKSVKGKIVLAADTFVWFEEEMIGKPEDDEEAVEMLESLSGKWYDVYTGVAVVSGKKEKTIYDVARVKFRKISDKEIREYVRNGLSEGKAGGFTLEGYGATFVEKLEGNFYTVQGLPLSKTFELLAQFGVLPNPKKSREWRPSQ